MLGRTTFLVLATAIVLQTGHAAEPPADRLRDRLPAETKDRALPNVSTPDDPAAIGTQSSEILASPRQIVLTGAVALSPDVFEPVFSKYLNRGLSRADLAALARAVTDRYRAEGYFLSRAVIPPQALAHGVLSILVEEGRYADVTFSDGHGAAYRDYFTTLLAEVPARRATLERTLLVLGELGGVRVVSSRSVPIPGARGLYTLAVTLETDKADGQLYADNRGEGGGDAVQVSAQAGFNDVGGPGRRLDISVFTDPANPGRRQFMDVSYSAPLGLRGSTVTVSGSASNSVDGAFGSGRYQSRGTDVSLSVRHPVVLTRQTALWVGASVMQSNSDVSVEGFGLRRDELSIVRAGAELEIRDSWRGQNRVTVTASAGRDQFRAPSPLHPMARADDRASFTTLSLFASRFQEIDGPWSAFMALRGQYSSDDLPEDEAISFGGARFGRAFDYGEIEGDTGVGAQIELRFTLNTLDFAQSLQAYAFGDAAAVWIRDGDGEPDTLSSAGMGVRAVFGDGYRAGLEAAAPVTRTPNGKDNRDPRVFATVSKAF